jgi:hypothetical protein
MWLEPEMKIHAPEIGRAWYNTAPLAMHDLRSRVVLVDFWDYTWSNCLRRRVMRSPGLTKPPASLIQ